MSEHNLDNLPPAIRSKLDELKATLIERLGDRLQALVVHGSAVRGGFVEGRSDVDVLIVLRDDRRDLLESIGNAVLTARTSARIESMLLRGSEIPAASDVFPLLYEDVKRCHVLLHGSDPFAGLEISDAHRRLRIEQELREARIRLRLVLSEAPSLPRRLPGALSRKMKQLRSPLAALLRMRGEAGSDDLDAVLAAASRRYDVDGSAFAALEEQPEAAFDALCMLLDRAIEDADRLQIG